MNDLQGNDERNTNSARGSSLQFDVHERNEAISSGQAEISKRHRQTLRGSQARLKFVAIQSQVVLSGLSPTQYSSSQRINTADHCETRIAINCKIIGFLLR